MHIVLMSPHPAVLQQYTLASLLAEHERHWHCLHQKTANSDADIKTLLRTFNNTVVVKQLWYTNAYPQEQCMAACTKQRTVASCFVPAQEGLACFALARENEGQSAETPWWFGWNQLHCPKLSMLDLRHGVMTV